MLIACSLALTGCVQVPQAEQKETVVKDETKLPPKEPVDTAKCLTSQLVDGSCEPADALVYSNEEYAVTFKYPKGWTVVKEDTFAQDDKAVLVVTFENTLNKEATVQFRNYMPENAAKMGWVSDANNPAKEYKTDYYQITMNYLVEDESFAAENGVDLTGDKVNYTRLTPLNPALKTTPEFMFGSPAENFDEYNKFVILAASTIK